MANRYRALVSVVFIILQGCAKEATPAARQRDRDFYITTAPVGFKVDKLALESAVSTVDGCEEHLKDAVCETTASADEIVQDWSAVSCSTNSQSYVPALMNLYAEMPELMRPSLCTLQRIFISDGITSTAFASPIMSAGSSGMPVGGLAGFRKSTFVQQPDGARLITWKEQLAYGGSTRFLSNDPNLVQISYGLKLEQLPKDGLFYVMIHELGHLIDFENNINGNCRRNCRDTQVGWAPLSWSSSREPLSDASFYRQTDFCFYGCQTYLDGKEALKIYSSLQQSSFITTYAGSDAFEDFAENWAWYVMRKFKNPDYRISVPGQGELDMNAVFSSNEKIKTKLAFIDRLWNNPKLKVAHGN